MYFPFGISCEEKGPDAALCLTEYFRRLISFRVGFDVQVVTKVPDFSSWHSHRWREFGGGVQELVSHAFPQDALRPAIFAASFCVQIAACRS